MKIMYTLLTGIILLFAVITNAQIDQVSVGASYSQQAYYDLSTGSVTNIDNTAWDIAFSNIGQLDAGVFVNESITFMGSPVELYFLSHYEWSEPIVLDTALLIEDNRLYNPEENWTEGAFNTIGNPDDPEDYGWGAYNPATQNIEGFLIYIMKKRDGSFIKIQIVELAAGEYTFRYANLDGSNELTAVASKSNAGDDPLIYFSFDSGTFIDFPDNTDLIFERYISPLDDGSGGFLQYTVTGVLLAPGAEGVAALEVDPATVDEADYADQYSPIPSAIGHDWKYFSFSTGWNVYDDQAYFVKTKEGDKYKIVFLDFEGSSTGISTLEKTYLGTVSAVEELNVESPISIYPNPCSNSFFVEGNGTFSSYSRIYDSVGELVFKGTIGNNRFDIPSNWKNGIYHVVFETENNSISKSILIAR